MPGFVTIDGTEVDDRRAAQPAGVAVRQAGIELPTFCYHSELSVYGACRMCVVEGDNERILARVRPRPSTAWSCIRTRHAC